MWICHCGYVGSGLLGSFFLLFLTVGAAKAVFSNVWVLIRDALCDAYVKGCLRQPPEKLEETFSSWETMGDSVNYMNYFQ